MDRYRQMDITETTCIHNVMYMLSQGIIICEGHNHVKLRLDQHNKHIGVGRFRILGGPRLRILGGPRGGQIPSRHMTS